MATLNNSHPLFMVGGSTNYLVEDTFTDVLGTSLDAHTMDSGDGWTISAGSWLINNNNEVNLPVDSSLLTTRARIYTPKLVSNKSRHSIEFSGKATSLNTSFPLILLDYNPLTPSESIILTISRVGDRGIWALLLVNGGGSKTLAYTNISANFSNYINFKIEFSPPNIYSLFVNNLLISSTTYTAPTRNHAGILAANSSDIYLDNFRIGYSTTPNINPDLPLFIEGIPQQETMPLYLPGQFNQKAAPLYIGSFYNSSSGIPLYTVAEIGSGDANMNLFVGDPSRTGQNTSNSFSLVLPYDANTLPSGTRFENSPLYIQGGSAYNDEPVLPLWVSGYKKLRTFSEDPFPLFVRANEFKSHSGVMPLVMPATPTSTGEIPLYMGGVITTNSTLFPLYMAVGKDRFNSNIPLYLNSPIPTGFNTTSLYIDAYGTSSGNMPLYLRVKEQFSSNSGIPLYMEGTFGYVSGRDSIKLYAFSELDPKNSLPLHTKGFAITRTLSKSYNLYAKGALAVENNGNTNLFVYNIQGSGNTNIPLYTFSTVPTAQTSNVPSYTTGHGTKNSVTELYVNGF